MTWNELKRLYIEDIVKYINEKLIEEKKLNKYSKRIIY